MVVGASGRVSGPEKTMSSLLQSVSQSAVGKMAVQGNRSSMSRSWGPAVETIINLDSRLARCPRSPSRVSGHASASFVTSSRGWWPLSTRLDYNSEASSPPARKHKHSSERRPGLARASGYFGPPHKPELNVAGMHTGTCLHTVFGGLPPAHASVESGLRIMVAGWSPAPLLCL